MRTLCCIFLILLCAARVPVQAKEFHLLTRASFEGLKPLVLSTEDRHLLQDKKQLVMGIFPSESPPYGMTNMRDEYEGLSADYAGLVAKQLGLTLHIEQYASLEQALNALKSGKIDLVPSLTARQDESPLLFSDPYASEQPVLGMRANDNDPLPGDLHNIDVAVVKTYLPLSLLRQAYPHANFRMYENYQDALSAVSFGTARVYLGNSFSLSRNFLNNLRMVRFSQLPQKMISFAFPEQATELQTLVNRAISNVPREEKNELLRIWQPDMVGMNQSLNTPPFTAEERKWMMAHPVIKMVMFSQDKAAPMTIIDQSGALRGMVSDLITLVTLKTGLRFSFETVDTSQELVNRVNSADFDMFASLTPSAQREQQILFTRPYLRSTFALTTRVGNNDIHSLPDLRGKRLAMVANTSVENMVHARYPEIEIVPVQNITEMMAKVEKGQADAGVDILVMVDYQIKTHFQNKLKMVSAIGSSPAWVSFGVGRADPELRSILDKVLLSIPPVEIEELANRWRPSDLIVYDSFWQRYQAVLIASIIFFVLLMLMVIGWSLYQRQIIRRKAELRRELNVQLAQLQALVTSMPFPVSLRDKDGRLTYCNQRYLVETGVIYEEALGKTMPEHPGLRTPEQAAFYHNQLIDVVKTGVPIVEDRRYDLWDNPDSSIGVTVYQWIQPFNDSDGNVVGVIAGWMDISEREALFAELREAKERAEDSSRAKSVFLSTMSHEIRTPMNAIIGMLDMALKKGRSGEQDLQALEVAYDSAESLVGLIGDILDISRIEGGQLEYHPEAVHPGKLIDNLMKVFQGLAIDKNITLTRHIPEDGLEQVLADPLRIKQVLSNLLSNAIKFTDQGGVSLTLTQQKDVAADHVYLVIEVQDSGIGIDEKQQAALFKPFSQADNRRAGTGLGLYISRTICEKMGGTLTLSSEKGVGTCARATLMLPMAESQSLELEEKAEEGEKLPLRSVLVVDDNAANRMLLAKQLSWLGQQADLAADGHEALQMWQRGNYDVVITDCNMPGLNGYQLTEIIRESEEDLGRAPSWIMGFTANAMHVVIKRCLEAGMNSCLFKPCSISSLAAALRAIGAEKSPADVTVPAAPESSDVDRQMEAAMRDLMVATLAEDLTQLDELNLDHHRAEIADLVHRIAGSVRIARQHRLADACLQLEIACRDPQQQSDALQPRLSELVTRLAAYQAQLESAAVLSDIAEEE